MIKENMRRGVKFNLTPALFPGERGKRSQPHGQSSAGLCLTRLQITGRQERLSPLLAGEGQGEGTAAHFSDIYNFTSTGWPDRSSDASAGGNFASIMKTSLARFSRL